MSESASKNPKLGPYGLRVQGETLPLYAGSVHYFRLARTAWQPALESLRALGARFVDIAVPWSVHEKSAGQFDFGEDNPRLDVTGFIDLAARSGLSTLVRVGPALGAELPHQGIPERVIWDEACMARTAAGAPHVTASLPAAYPTPSRASRAFHAHAAVFLRAVAERLGPLAGDGGPLAVAIVGDESHTGLFAQSSGAGDCHPDAVEQYRRFLKHRYGSVSALRRVHGPDALFDKLEPPHEIRTIPERLGALLDWAEVQEVIAEGALYRYRAVLDQHGLEGVTKIYEAAEERHLAAVDPARIERVTDALSFECRASASERGRRAIVRQVTRAAARARVRGVPVFASKLFTGFAADMPARTDDDDLFVTMTALAYGARGIGLHAAVQRDRWIGGPIDARGRLRPSAERWEKLLLALTALRHHELSRDTAVSIVLPRGLERLDRLWSAVAPFALPFSGKTRQQSSPETDLDPFRDALAEASEFVGTLERVLDKMRIPYGFAQPESLERTVGASRWTIVVCPGALDDALMSAIGQHALAGRCISVGPRPPERDAHFLPSAARLPTLQNAPVPLVLPRGPATLMELVTTTLESLGVAPLPAEPETIHTTLHVDSGAKPRALFVINPSGEETTARVAVPGAISTMDALSGDYIAVTDERLSVTVAPRTVRLLALASPL
jgi:beta-galactosidase